MNRNNRAIFISGIDTDAGKTYATAYYALLLQAEGYKVITQKFIQTGCTGTSEDIEAHRRLMRTGTLPEDTEGLTAPVIFSYPASAQLAARLDKRDIDLKRIEEATDELLRRYDRVLIEGAGGLMVPVTDDYFTIDYVVSHNLPMVLTTNGRLGSINHTVLSLEAIFRRGIELQAIIYNRHFDNDAVIAEDTVEFIRRYVGRLCPSCRFIVMPEYENWNAGMQGIKIS